MEYPSRIKLLLKSLNLTAAEFADEIEIQRSSISHLLSGRNKPSLQFLDKCLSQFPNVNPYFLIQGKGDVLKEEKQPNLQLEGDFKVRRDLVENTEDTVNTDKKKQNKPSSKTNTNGEFTNVITNVNQHGDTPNTSKLIHQIIFIYDDGTFKVSTPSN